MRSGNDAAVALAEHISGSESKFVELMNKKLIDYGLTNSHFTNASGLDSKNHYSSASDVAKMLQIALESSLFRAISSTTLYKNNTYNSYWTNKHKLIGSSDILATSGKTGYTKKAGRTLATLFYNKGKRIIVVTLNTKNDWEIHSKLAKEYLFHEPK